MVIDMRKHTQRKECEHKDIRTWSNISSVCHDCKKVFVDKIKELNGFKRVQLYPDTPRVFGFECPVCKEKVGSWEIEWHKSLCDKYKRAKNNTGECI